MRTGGAIELCHNASSVGLHQYSEIVKKKESLRCTCIPSLKIVFSRTAVSTPSQSSLRGSGAVFDRGNNAHAMSLPSGDYQAISTARPPPISGHLGDNTVPTFGQENEDFLFTRMPGSGGRARRRTRLELYGSRPMRNTTRRIDGARDR